MSKKLTLSIIATCIISFFGVYYAHANKTQTAYDTPLAITTKAGKTHDFLVERATTPKQQQIGLMHRAHMSKDQGMLFIFPTPAPQAFWMKNTHIPLDIFYISATGRINQIYKMTTPFSTQPLPSDAPALAVLEINGGLSDKLGIKVGDIVQHSIFHTK